MTKFEVYLESFEFWKKGATTITESEITRYLFEEDMNREPQLIGRFDTKERRDLK